MSVSLQVTHAPDPTLRGWTLCGRAVAGSLELDATRPTCHACALASRGLYVSQQDRDAYAKRFSELLVAHVRKQSPEGTRELLDAPAGD